uniref:Delta-like protein n=1 Tax=Angiostrongylus cantonensis TaxID=6313 RepID=A0A158P958_ANGCA
MNITTADTETRALLSSNTSKEKFTIGSEFIPAEGSSDFLDIAFRSSCQQSYYGSGCQRYCKASFSYTCDADGKRICLTGWFGEQCDQPICANGCKHGRCVEPGRCECDHGFFGSTCSNCRRSENCRHGTCRNNQPFTCACELGWGGILCERDLEYCSRHKPCKNGGICTNGGFATDFTCQCPEAFGGATCEIEVPSICQQQGICRNGGICTNIDTKLGRCICVKGFEGRYCERRMVQTHCTQNTCKNGGSCQGESVCICPLCFSGYDCSVIDEECLWNRVNVSFVTKNGSNEEEQNVPTRILMFMAFISITMLASCVVVFFFKYTKMKRLLHDPITQNTLNERRQIHVDLSKQSTDNRSHSDDSYKVFVIPSKKHSNSDVEKSCDGIDYDNKRYVTQQRGRYCTLPCLDVVVAEPEHQYAEIEYRPTTVSLDDKQFTENACVV